MPFRKVVVTIFVQIRPSAAKPAGSRLRPLALTRTIGQLRPGRAECADLLAGIWAPQLCELLALAKVAGVLGLDAAIANLAGIAPEEDRDAVADTVAGAFARKAVAPLALGRQI